MGHISRIAEIIDKLAPDIIHLTEVEDCHVIDVLISLLKEKETYLGYIVKASTVSNLALQNVAIITKLHPTRNLLRTDETLEAPWDGNSSCNPSWSNFGSNLPKHYLTQFEVPIFTKKTDLYPRSSLQLAFFGLHLTAFPYKENRCFEREGQAYLVTRLIAKTYNSPDSPKEIIITGDFNDLDPNVLQSIPRTGLSNTMNIIRGNVRLGGQLIHMENILNRIPQEKNYSSQFPGENYRDLLDHILLSPGMVARLESVEILNDLYSPEDNVSDHWPVLAIFKMFDDE